MSAKRNLLKKINESDFMSSYVEGMLWAEQEYDEEGNMGRPLEENYEIEDFTLEALKEIISDCEGFLSDPEVERAIESAGGDYSQAGFDFYLTRNRHGAGFWDGDWPEPQATILTDAAEAYGPQGAEAYRGELYVIG